MDRVIRKLMKSALAIGLMSPIHAFAREQNQGGKDSARAVFVMNNSVERNEVIALQRAADGTLLEAGRFATGGRGSGGTTDPLESQGSLTLSQDHSLLFAVNAGSGQVSVFRVEGSELELQDTVSSGGSEPNAVAQHGNLVYVLNVGGSSDVVGFTMDHGRLEQIPQSTRFLTTNNSEAASLAFSPNGKFLVVTERATNNIDVFAVQADGRLAPIVVNTNGGPGTFAASFAPNGVALVSETGPAGVANGSAISSYAVQANGTLTTISASVPTFGAANCWNAVTPDGRFVYVSNAGSATISGFAIGASGTLTPIAGTVAGANPAGATNLDITVSADGKFLYTLNTGNGTIGIFAIQKEGTLVNAGSADGIGAKAGFNGIAAN
ncbi:MAG TPA: beta-propeller fold lactonase family protein [Candidatus Acidoferrum sp.]|nr:beta-propeller fold lactonase family protein [Candidatus Acidoferrum sp.]